MPLRPVHPMLAVSMALYSRFAGGSREDGGRGEEGRKARLFCIATKLNAKGVSGGLAIAVPFRARTSTAGEEGPRGAVICCTGWIRFLVFAHGSESAVKDEYCKVCEFLSSWVYSRR